MRTIMKFMYVIGFLAAVTTPFVQAEQVGSEDDTDAVRVRNIVRESLDRVAETTEGEPATWVLAIGIEDYSLIQQLTYTGDDASAFVRAFSEVGQVPARRLLLVADHEKASLKLSTDSKTILPVIKEFVSRPGPKDTLVFFFSGHGYVDPNDQVMYLATSDFDVTRPASTGLSVDALRRALTSSRAKHQLIFLDACHSGAFELEDSLDGRALANSIATKKGIAVVSSCSSQQQSIEARAIGHGVFTQCLVQGIRGQANSEVDSVIDIQEAFRFVKTHVPVAAKKVVKTHRQTPVFAAKNLIEIPVVLNLRKPDRPSDLIAAFNDVPVGAIGFDPILIQAMAQAAAADPVTVIGRLKWIMENEKPQSPSYRAAKEALRGLDQKILAGKIKLPRE